MKDTLSKIVILIFAVLAIVSCFYTVIKLREADKENLSQKNLLNEENTTASEDSGSLSNQDQNDAEKEDEEDEEEREDHDSDSEDEKERKD